MKESYIEEKFSAVRGEEDRDYCVVRYELFCKMPQIEIFDSFEGALAIKFISEEQLEGLISALQKCKEELKVRQNLKLKQEQEND